MLLAQITTPKNSKATLGHRLTTISQRLKCNGKLTDERACIAQTRILIPHAAVTFQTTIQRLRWGRSDVNKHYVTSLMQRYSSHAGMKAA
jgi:hypothetical protein